jgi:hypothetical protein
MRGKLGLKIKKMVRSRNDIVSNKTPALRNMVEKDCKKKSA